MKTAKQPTRELTGAIVRFTTNKHRDIDGLVIDQQGDLVEVKFPPHTARFIRDIALEGGTVRVVPDEKPHPPHHGHKHPKPRVHLASIGNAADGREFGVDSVEPPHPAESGPLVSFTIRKPRFTRGGKEEQITGVIFEDNYIHLHPDEYEGGEEALASGAVLHIKAKKRSADAGFVNADGYTVYHAHTVNIGEK